jgi:hypothetical protein
MILKLSVDSAAGVSAASPPGRRSGQQVVSLQVDKEAFQALIGALKSAGVDTSAMDRAISPADRSVQESAAPSSPFSQNLGTPAGSADAKTDPPFSPAYRPAVITMAAAVPATWALNPTYFATKETAEWIAKKYGTGEVVEVPFGGNGGPFQASDMEFHIKLASGKTVNAGILAAYFDRNPESQFPGVADKLIRDVLKSVG